MPVYALDSLVPQIHPYAFVHPGAVVIGNVEIGAQSSIWPGAVLRADFGRIVIGERTSIQDGTVIHATEEWATMIGDDCVVGHNAHLEGCTVENRCLVGSGSVVLNRAEWIDLAVCLYVGNAERYRHGLRRVDQPALINEPALINQPALDQPERETR